MHRIEICRTTVLESVRIILVGPNGSNGGMASLCYHATHRPRVYQVSPEHHILNQNVTGVERDGRGYGVRGSHRSGCGEMSDERNPNPNCRAR